MNHDKLMIYAALIGAGHANLMRGEVFVDALMWGIVILDIARTYLNRKQKEIR